MARDAMLLKKGILDDWCRFSRALYQVERMCLLVVVVFFYFGVQKTNND